MSAEGVENVKKKQEKLSVCVQVGRLYAAANGGLFKVIGTYQLVLDQFQPTVYSLIGPSSSHSQLFLFIVRVCVCVCVCMREVEAI